MMNCVSWLMYARLIVPVLLGNLCEVWFLYSLFNFLNFPISTRLFGKNKTVRGIITFPIGHCMSFMSLRYALNTLITGYQWEHVCINASVDSRHWIQYSLVCGLACNLIELPNSYMKRRRGIPSGLGASGYLSQIVHTILDHCDSVFTESFVAWMYGFPWSIVRNIIIIGPLIHICQSTIIRPLLSPARSRLKES